MNICIKCTHCVRKEHGTPRDDCDYNIVCSAFDQDFISCLDPVLGKAGYSRQNDLGGFIFCGTIKEARPTCRSKNPDGQCQRFEEATR